MSDLTGMALYLSELACFQCAKPEGWAEIARVVGYLTLCERHAAVFSAQVALIQPTEGAQS